MATIKEEDIRGSLTRVQDLLVAATAKETSRGVCRALEPALKAAFGQLLSGAAGDFDPAKWAALTDDEKAQIAEILEGVERALSAIEEDGPRDQESIMFKTYASNTAACLLTSLGILAIVGIVWQLYVCWPPVVDKSSEQEILRIVIMMGALGGLLHFTSSLALFIGNRKLQRSWVVYYLLMPFEGAALAPIVYLLLRVGVMAPGTGTSNINVLGLYAFAGLTGLFSKQAIEMLADVFTVIFKKVQSKDSLSKDGKTTTKADQQ